MLLSLMGFIAIMPFVANAKSLNACSANAICGPYSQRGQTTIHIDVYGIQKDHKYVCKFKVMPNEHGAHPNKVKLNNIKTSSPGIGVDFEYTGDLNTSVLFVDAKNTSGSVHYEFKNTDLPIYTDQIQSNCIG